MVLLGYHSSGIWPHDTVGRPIKHVRTSTALRSDLVRLTTNCIVLYSAEKALYLLVAALGIGALFQVWKH